MKTLTSKLTIAAAALAITAGAAWAQPMKADIPFAFRAGDSVLAPGTYRIQVKSSNSVVFLSGEETRKTVIMLSSPADVAKEWKAKGEPVLAFECSAGRCVLAKVWAGEGSPAIAVQHGSLGADHAALTLIRLVRASGN